MVVLDAWRKMNYNKEIVIDLNAMDKKPFNDYSNEG